MLAMLTPIKPLRGNDYPALVRLWDNDADAIYDREAEAARTFGFTSDEIDAACARNAGRGFDSAPTTS